MKSVKKSISITLDYPILEKIQQLAEYEDRSISSYINLVLRKHIGELEQRQPESLNTEECLGQNQSGGGRR